MNLTPDEPRSSVSPESPLPVDPPVHAVTPSMVLALKQTRPWVLFISILGFIGAGLAVMGGLVMGAFMGIAGSFAGAAKELPAGMGPLLGVGVGVLYIVVGVLYFFPALFLYRFASGIAAMLRTDPVSGLEAALKAQKSFWKFVGISMIVILFLYVLIIFAVILVAGLAAARSLPGI